VTHFKHNHDTFNLGLKKVVENIQQVHPLSLFFYGHLLLLNEHSKQPPFSSFLQLPVFIDCSNRS